MRRRSVLIAVGLFLLAVLVVLAALAALARHEPSFYVRSAVPPGQVRQQQSKAFVQALVKLLNDISNKEPSWRASFTEAQINSYFEEEFLSSKVAASLLPEGVSAPRVVIEQDKIRLAFRYGTPPWSTIISIDFRVWLAPKERNVVVLQLQSLHAGSLPISAQSLLEELSDVLRKRNIDVSWYRHEGHPTAVLRFQSDQPRATVQLRQLELRHGIVTIVGRSVDPLPRQVVNPPPCPPRPAGN
jgi:hypothetical protein